MDIELARDKAKIFSWWFASSEDRYVPLRTCATRLRRTKRKN